MAQDDAVTKEQRAARTIGIFLAWLAYLAWLYLGGRVSIACRYTYGSPAWKVLHALLGLAYLLSPGIIAHVLKTSRRTTILLFVAWVVMIIAVVRLYAPMR